MNVKLISCKDLFRGDFNIVDVRTPAEFDNGHIPSAINIPLFSNDERAEIGTLFKQVSPEVAFDRGIEIVGPRMGDFIKQARALPKKKIVIYCWRGGMRSESMCWLLSMSGLDVVKIENGYKGYRTYIRLEFERAANIIILSGRTGSGKTHYLNSLADEGEQVLDLEGLANHMGSSFGYKGHNQQPTNEQFENNIYDVWKTFNLSQKIWIEDESAAIGKVRICDPLYKQMLNAQVVEVKIALAQRVDNILLDYKDVDKSYLLDACAHIKKRLGGVRYQKVVEFIEKNEYKRAVPILLEYYDALYDRYALKHPRVTCQIIDPTTEDLRSITIKKSI